MSEMEKLLDICSREQVEEHDDERAALKLKRRLLPLLLAGEALASPYADGIDGLIDDYKAAKRQAMEGKT